MTNESTNPIQSTNQRPYTYSSFRKTRTCTMPTAPSDVTVGGLHKAAVRIAWTPPGDQADKNLGYYAIRYRPNNSSPGGKAENTWNTARAAKTDTEKVSKHGLTTLTTMRFCLFCFRFIRSFLTPIRCVIYPLTRLSDPLRGQTQNTMRRNM